MDHQQKMEREKEIEEKFFVIVRALHAFFTGSATLMIGALPVLFQMDEIAKND